MKHKHAEVIKAFVDGVECEFEGQINEWHSIASLEQFDTWDKVRIKQEPQYLYVYNHINNVQPFMSLTLMRDTSAWVYLGKVEVLK